METAVKKASIPTCSWTNQCLLVNRHSSDECDTLRNQVLLLQCALIVGSLWLLGDMGARRRVLSLLHQSGRTLGTLRDVLVEYRDTLGDDGACRLALWCCIGSK